MKTRSLLGLAVLPALAWVLAVGCGGSRFDDSAPPSEGASFLQLGAHPRLTAGTALHVRLDETLSSESASAGDAWRGVTVAPVVVDGDEVIPAGSTVQGIVSAVAPATTSARATLEIEVRRLMARERETTLRATSPPVIAGSQRARNLDAMAGGVAPGMSPGVSPEASKGSEPVVLRSGAVVTFTVSREVAMR